MERNRGFTLIEALLATTIIAIGITVLMTMFQASYQVNSSTEEDTHISLAINSQAQRLMGSSRMQLQAEFGPTYTTPSFFHIDAIRATSVAGNVVSNPPPPPYDPYHGSWNAVTSKTGILNPVFAPDRVPAQGVITPIFPPEISPGVPLNPPPPTPDDLLAFEIRVEYQSELRNDLITERTIIWVSPNF